MLLSKHCSFKALPSQALLLRASRLQSLPCERGLCRIERPRASTLSKFIAPAARRALILRFCRTSEGKRSGICKGHRSKTVSSENRARKNARGAYKTHQCNKTIIYKCTNVIHQRQLPAPSICITSILQCSLNSFAYVIHTQCNSILLLRFSQNNASELRHRRSRYVNMKR